MTWKQLNFLVPDPQCETKEGIVTVWNDPRPEPPQAAIDAVSLTAVEARERDEAFGKEVDSSPALKAILDELESGDPGFSGRAKARHNQP